MSQAVLAGKNPVDPFAKTQKTGPAAAGAVYAAVPELPPVSPQVARRIEVALRALKPGATLFVDTEGTPHTGKESFLSGQSTPLVSFTSDKRSGLMIVHPGVPSRNPTFCRAKNSDPIDPSWTFDGSAQPLKYSTILTSGDRLTIAHVYEVEIPTRLLRNPTTPAEMLSQLLAAAEPGQIVELGRRAVPGCCDEVSRVHCTVQILGKSANPDGTFAMTVRVFPGIPGRGEIAFERADGTRERIVDAVTATPGARITIGQSLGTVQMPYSEGSLESAAQSISESVCRGELDFAIEALKTFCAPPRSEYSRDVVERQRVDIPNKEVATKALVLQGYIVAGLSLIREGKFEESRDHFRNGHALKLCGYEFRENNVFALGALEEREIVANIGQIGSRSWFKVQEKLVYPSFGMLRKGLEPRNDRERQLLEKWERDVALVYAEEYCHALQDLMGKNISRKVALLPQPDHEADVSLFFHEHGVKLLNHFVKHRYHEREEAFSLAGGFQAPGTQELFAATLDSIPLGDTLLIGRNPGRGRIGTPNVHDFAIPRPLDTRERSAHMAHSLLAPAEVSIDRTTQGYVVRPCAGEQSIAFVPDAAGYYHRLTGPETLGPGTPIYVGRSFRLVLP